MADIEVDFLPFCPFWYILLFEFFHAAGLLGLKTLLNMLVTYF